MKYSFWFIFIVIILGLLIGYPSNQMIKYYLNHSQHYHLNFGSIIILICLIVLITGIFMLIKIYTKWLKKFHYRMNSQGLFNNKHKEKNNDPI